VKAFLGSFVFLVLVALVICIDHLVDGILAHSYKNIILYGFLSVLLLLSLITLVIVR
jgi:hypothetical protein